MDARRAVLLIDFQVDFLDEGGRMPVSVADAHRVIGAANEVLSGNVLPDALPVFVVNGFPSSDVIGNLLRRHAAELGSEGARLDPRVRVPPGARQFVKRHGSAFSNPALLTYLRAENISTLWLLGVMTEACVRATAVAARREGFEVFVPEAGIAATAAWKSRLGTWAMRHAGVHVVSEWPPASVLHPAPHAAL